MMMISLDKFNFTAASNTGKKASTPEATNDKKLTALLAVEDNFNKIDTNGDGILTAPELETFKKKLADKENLKANGLSGFSGLEKAFDRFQDQQANLSVAAMPAVGGWRTRFGISMADIKKIDNDFRYKDRSADTGFNVLGSVYANATVKAKNLTVDASNPLDKVLIHFLNGLQAEVGGAERIIPTAGNGGKTKVTTNPTETASLSDLSPSSKAYQAKAKEAFLNSLAKNAPQLLAKSVAKVEKEFTVVKKEDGSFTVKPKETATLHNG
jgi:hypothetical protein